ncbi:hypothetical protein OIU80_03805 [Flavobacterium sp. LS1R47]|uniref:Uncharacterized protein n=1 Tax=Flavobacterium frigoritolerans TaxID=2987686 RepID=A0A9X3C636_9FLAO|nr:hypothetical protein [Flavobacterium frigoritolerans]MCV9931394.1 hypothetical protein [Flavobacterium frigoritolerans]
MKKTCILFCVFLFQITTTMFAQTGVNLQTSNVTLQIVAGNNVSPENGVMLPSITGNDLANKDSKYGKDQDGTMIFVTEAVSESKVTSKTKDVTKRGMYVYHNTPKQQWIPTFSGKAAISDDKIFVVVNRKSTRLMGSNVESIIWDGIKEGPNNNLIIISGNQTEITLPANRTIKVQGMIPVGYGTGTDSQKKTASTLSSSIKLVAGGTGIVYSNSPGFARSSNYQASNGGGAISPMMLINTGISGSTIKVDATRQNGVRTNIAGAAAHNTAGCYLIIEEI